MSGEKLRVLGFSSLVAEKMVRLKGKDWLLTLILAAFFCLRLVKS